MLVCGITEVDLLDAVRIVGGEDSLRAEQLLRALGTPMACQLALRVPVKQAVPLMHYLAKALENRRSGWYAGIKALHKAGDDKRIDYWMGVQMFTHFCLDKDPQRALTELMGTDRLVAR